MKVITNDSVNQTDSEDKAKLINGKKPKRRLRESKQVAQREVVPIDVQDYDACVAMWQSVVVQAFYDLFTKADNYEQRMVRANTIAWFGQGIGKNGQQTDLQTVCELAGLDVVAVMKLSKKVIRGECPNLIAGFNFRTLRKESSNRKPRKER